MIDRQSPPIAIRPAAPLHAEFHFLKRGCEKLPSPKPANPLDITISRAQPAPPGQTGKLNFLLPIKIGFPINKHRSFHYPIVILDKGRLPRIPTDWRW